MLEQFLQELQDSNPILQFIGVMIVAMIPFIEGYFAVPVGIAIGFSAVMTIVAAIVGNWISVMVVILASDRFKQWLQGRKTSERKQEKQNKRLERGQKLFHKFGVPGVSLLGPLLIGDHLAALICIASGASKRYVIIWQTIAIVVWAVGMGILVLLGINIVKY
ncbi:MAG: small multi-drug export protein [Candidatus Pristimantibacillus lignocellulolyticus]|uniref:Small multi-drug export protein n=1 Tax=Candidatus Pristimantibacillus lignocellulolyticus TaxID=2994561 RepID=A0A9J6Z9H5_9BACL|nr:MAG: small multi-drug export protein [Candidatus Pristimantibacillus lignocellulolyticus]